MKTDPNLVYTMAIAASYREGGNTAKAFEAARDNPKIPKTALMAAVLSGYLLGNGSVTGNGE